MSLTRILVVDDEKDLCELIAFQLESEKSEVVQAYDGPTALEKTQESPFDIIISDIKMPNMDGIELMEKVLKQPNKPKQFFLMTGFTDISTEGLLEKGATRVFMKPGELKEMIHLIREQYSL